MLDTSKSLRGSCLISLDILTIDDLISNSLILALDIFFDQRSLQFRLYRALFKILRIEKSLNERREYSCSFSTFFLDSRFYMIYKSKNILKKFLKAKRNYLSIKELESIVHEIETLAKKLEKSNSVEDFIGILTNYNFDHQESILLIALLLSKINISLSHISHQIHNKVSQSPTPTKKEPPVGGIKVGGKQHTNRHAAWKLYQFK